MNEIEEQYAKEIYAAIQSASTKSARSQQSADFLLGISDVGYCAERTRRLLDHQVPEDTDHLAAFIGTAVGDHAEQAIKTHLWPDAIVQAEVFLPLTLQGKTYRLPGHPDVVLPGWGIWDGKTDYGLSTVERQGPSFSQEFQRNAYALAAWQDGLLGDMPLEDVQVGNFWIDRAAIDKRVHVDVRPFDQEIIDRGIEWLDSVVYAFLHEEEADKEPPRQVCEVTCGFFRVCREYETDVHGLLTGPAALSLDQYVEGRAMEAAGRRLKDQAKAQLEGVSGSNGRYKIRQTWINPVEVPASIRKGYYRMDVSKVKGVD